MSNLTASTQDGEDWSRYEIDEDELEDIEVSLYGMIHHAANEDCGWDNRTTTDLAAVVAEIVPSLSFTVEKDHDAAISQTEINKGEVEVIGNKFPKPVPVCSPSENSTPLVLKLGRSERKSRKPKKDPTSMRKNQVSRELSAAKRNTNPFKERLVVEQCLNNSKLKNGKLRNQRNPSIVDLSDDEDSKYQSMSKLKKKEKKPEPKKYVEQDSSDSDSSVLILNRDSSYHSMSESLSSLSDIYSESSDEYNDSSSEFSDFSDSDIEVLNQSNSSGKNTSLRLNTSGASTDLELLPESINAFSVSRDWEKYSCKKWSKEMIAFYDRDGQGKDLQKIANSLPAGVRWHVDNADRFGDLPSLGKNRYFAKLRCMNCKRVGHSTRECKEEKKIVCCHMCGAQGHTSFQCPMKVCFGCGRPSKIYIECCPECRRERTAVCMICKLNHLTSDCPDLWRRYHLTTTPDEKPIASAVSLKPNHLQKCYNCAGSGHLPFNCRAMRSNKYPMANPTVFQYEDSCKYLMELTDGGRNPVVRDNKSIWVVGASPTKSGGGNKLVKYTFSSNMGISDGMVESARSSVLKEVNHIDISWRRQPKKGRFFVEFSGHGDTIGARNKFKKLINFRKPATPENKRGFKAQPQNTPMNPSPGPNKSLAPVIRSVSLISRGRNKDEYLTRQVNLTPKKKNNLGKLLGKCELRFRVSITSSFNKNNWEIHINQRNDSIASSTAASRTAIVSFLNNC